MRIAPSGAASRQSSHSTHSSRFERTIGDVAVVVGEDVDGADLLELLRELGVAGD